MDPTRFDDRPIGVFDSGVGGLTVVFALRDQLPDEEIRYFGDMERCPYGNRDPSEVQAYAREIVDFLVAQDVKLVVVACNTATAVALPMLQRRYEIPVIGVIRPGARAALEATKTGRVGVIGTAVTVASGAYAKEIHRLSPDVQVFSEACPGFVPLVEQGVVAGEAVSAIVSQQLRPISERQIDTLILGCTHYPLLARPIQSAVGPAVRLISSADETAREVSDKLTALGALHGPRQAGAKDRFYTSSDGSRMRRALQLWLGETEDSVDVQSVDVHILAAVDGN